MGGEVKNMRALVLVVGALVMVAACGHVPGGQVSPGGYKLYEAAATGSIQQLSVIDSHSQSVERSMPLGTPSRDWTHLYTVKGDLLVDLDPQTGSVLHQLRLPGYYKLPLATISGVPGGLSPNGHWLVLESFGSGSVPSASHFVVVDTTYAGKPQTFDLNGYYQFDAINDGGGRVYLIQYLSSSQYYVRFYNVPARTLDPQIVFDKSDGLNAMAGTRLSGVASRDDQYLYSLYVRSDGTAFIHALSLENPIAFCIDLPGTASSPDGYHWSLALNAAGTHLYATNGATGIVTDLGVDGGVPGAPRTAKLSNMQSASVPGIKDVAAKEFGGNAAAVSPDGKTLVMAGKTGVVWIDTATLNAKDRQLPSWSVWSLAMSPDGTTVYAMNDAGMIAELPMNGAHQATTFGGATGRPLDLIRVAVGP
jgi:hypothetical protein